MRMSQNMKALKWQLMQSKLSVLASGGRILNFFGATGGGAEISLGAAAPWLPWNRPW